MKRIWQQIMEFLGLADRGTRYRWPANEAAARDAYNAAKAAVRQHIGSTRRKHDRVDGYSPPAARRIHGAPVIWQPDLQAWVRGWASYDSRRKRAEAHAADGVADVLFHEYAHVRCFLHGIHGHDPRLDGHVPSWRYARSVTGVAYGTGEIGPYADVDVVRRDGSVVKIHADGVTKPERNIA